MREIFSSVEGAVAWLPPAVSICEDLLREAGRAEALNVVNDFFFLSLCSI